MRILITGGAGYIGSALIEKLILKKEISEIIVYDNLSRGNRNLFIGTKKVGVDKVKFVQGDILDSRKLRKSLSGVEVVYHLAANVTTPFSDQNPHLFEQVNHWGTAELVYAIEESEVKKRIYLSSVSAYGTSFEPLSIEANLNPRTFYGISKVRGEEHVQRLADKIDTSIIRCGNVYGYHKSMRFDAVINRFLFEANFYNRITINGSGEQHRPFIHIEKATNVLSELALLEFKEIKYNLVDHNMAVGEIVEYLRQLYPSLEMLFVNQQMKMRELKVDRSETLSAFFGKEISFSEELKNFRDQFAF